MTRSFQRVFVPFGPLISLETLGHPLTGLASVLIVYTGDITLVSEAD